MTSNTSSFGGQQGETDWRLVEMWLVSSGLAGQRILSVFAFLSTPPALEERQKTLGKVKVGLLLRPPLTLRLPAPWESSAAEGQSWQSRKIPSDKDWVLISVLPPGLLGTLPSQNPATAPHPPSSRLEENTFPGAILLLDFHPLPIIILEKLDVSAGSTTPFKPCLRDTYFSVQFQLKRV